MIGQQNINAVVEIGFFQKIIKKYMKMYLIRDKQGKMRRNLYVNLWEAKESVKQYQEIIKVEVDIKFPKIRRPFFPKPEEITVYYFPVPVVSVIGKSGDMFYRGKAMKGLISKDFIKIKK